MKIWLRSGSLMLLVLLIPLLIVQVNEISFTSSSCCLCNAIRYHAPCLVDLETGTITELSIYDPHPTITGELARVQYTTGTFSLVTCGEARGYRDTTHKKIEINIPEINMSGQGILCAQCKEKFVGESDYRYLLMDLYNTEKAYAIPLIEEVIVIRCYVVSIDNLERGMQITIIGNRESQ